MNRQTFPPNLRKEGKNPAHAFERLGCTSLGGTATAIRKKEEKIKTNVVRFLQ